MHIMPLFNLFIVLIDNWDDFGGVYYTLGLTRRWSEVKTLALTSDEQIGVLGPGKAWADGRE